MSSHPKALGRGANTKIHQLIELSNRQSGHRCVTSDLKNKSRQVTNKPCECSPDSSKKSEIVRVSSSQHPPFVYGSFGMCFYFALVGERSVPTGLFLRNPLVGVGGLILLDPSLFMYRIVRVHSGRLPFVNHPRYASSFTWL